MAALAVLAAAANRGIFGECDPGCWLMPRQYVVKQGDCISSLAADFGFLPDTIWNDSGNADLQATREKLGILFPGDVVIIPDIRLRAEECQTDQKHVFELKGRTEKFRLILLDERDLPRENVEYTLVVAGRTFHGVTGDDGLLEETIRANARQGKLLLRDGITTESYTLNLGHLDPITEVTGVQARLTNLGFNCGSIDGILSEATIAAIREFQEQFQEQQDLPPAGEMDDNTRNKLEEIYGS